MLRRLMTEKGYPIEAYAMAGVLYGFCAAAMLIAELSTLDLVYFEPWSFRWTGGLLGIACPPVIAAGWFFSNEWDTWFPKRMLAGWCLGIAMGGAAVVIRAWLHI